MFSAPVGIRFEKAANTLSMVGKSWPSESGLTADTKILIGSSDGCMATLGAGIWNSDKATITIEDSSAVRVVGHKLLYDEKKRMFNYLITEN